MDSLRSQRFLNVAIIKTWIRLLGREEGMEIPWEVIRGLHPHTPQQNGVFDCGVWLLHYVEVFLKRPRDLVARFLLGEEVPRRRWDLQGLRP